MASSLHCTFSARSSPSSDQFWSPSTALASTVRPSTQAKPAASRPGGNTSAVLQLSPSTTQPGASRDCQDLTT
eukprot:3682683-Rhodomonas_salina.1